MARYNGLIIPRSYNDYYSRSDPQAIRDIVALAADGELNAESKNPLQNQAIAKIVPNTASETNELADKNFVNSTVGTNTANYIYKTESGGEKVPFSSVTELEAYAGTVTNNDYAFVTGIDENGNTYYDRYKADVNDGVVTWAKEYRLNNSSFTAEQWAAIQSGITAEKVAQFEGAVSPVDVVQSDNMSAVTSNAVYEALTNLSELNQLYDDSHRPSSANIIPKKNKLSYMLATSAMTENKPISDGYIINLNWDNSDILLQLFVPRNAEGRIGTRIKEGEWNDWEYYTKDSDIFNTYENFTLIKENKTYNSTESGEFTAIKNAIINISNGGSNSTTSEMAWGRVIVGGLIIGGYNTLDIGMGTTLFIKSGTTFYYQLHNNNIVKLKITYKYV